MKASISDLIYMDNAATSWPKPDAVTAAMSDILPSGFANPGRSGHRMSVDAARMIFSVRNAAAALFGVPDPQRIAFFGNATLALNAAINGLLGPGDHVVTTGMEHNSVMRPLRAHQAAGVDITVAECGGDGSLDPSSVERAIRANTKAVVVSHSSNVTGTIAPIDEIAEIARDNGVITIVDGAQSAGIIPVNLIKSRIDIFAFTGHKGLYGPQGTGGIYVAEGLEHSIRATLRGGTGSLSEKEEHPDFMPDKFEPGTPNCHGIALLGKGLEFVRSVGVLEISAKENALTARFIDGLLSINGVTVYGLKGSKGRTSVVSINIKHMMCSEVSQTLDEEFGIMTRPGLHCAPSAHRTIGTFDAGTVRFSLGYFNTEEHIDRALSAVAKIALQ